MVQPGSNPLAGSYDLVVLRLVRCQVGPPSNGEHQLMEVKRKLLVPPGVAGERTAELCAHVQNLNDDGKMSDGTLLLVMISQIKTAEIAILETIRKEQRK